MNESAITQKTNDPLAELGFAPNNLSQAIALSEMLGKSGLVPRAIAGKPSDILVVLLTGHEFGLGPMASLRLLSVIDGKAVIGGEAYTAVVQATPECEFFRCIESTDKIATFECKKRGSDKIAKLSWTIEQAAKAQLLGKDNWKKYPEAMLRWRCASALAKLEFAARFAGVYVEDEADELRETASATTAADGGGQVIDLRPTTDQLADRMRKNKAAQETAPVSASRATVDVVVEKPKAETVADKRSKEAGQREVQAAEVMGGALGLDTKGPEFMPEGSKPLEPEKLPHQVADEKKAAAAAEGPVMIFGEHKRKLISQLDGPTLLTELALGESKIPTLKSDNKSTAEQKIAKVRSCINDIKAEMEKRDAALLREPGSDDDID